MGKPDRPEWQGSFGQRLGMEYLRVGDGEAQAELVLGSEHCNPNGICHGGAIFTLADDSMGAAAFSITPQGKVPTSVQVNVHFARSARAGDRLLAKTRVLSSGKHMLVLETRIEDDQANLVALLSASYMFVVPRK
jgi:uncharacterized protein (TIGR00369 family)